mgnify:CR=1 FL=1
MGAASIASGSRSRARFTAKVWLELRRVATASVARQLKSQIEREEAVARGEREEKPKDTKPRSGPVTEGVIAWVIGFGLLGVVMYLLGEKAGDTPSHGDPDD